MSTTLEKVRDVKLLVAKMFGGHGEGAVLIEMESTLSEVEWLLEQEEKDKARPFDPRECGFHSVDKSYKNPAITRWEFDPGAWTVGWVVEREGDFFCLSRWGVNQFWGIPWPRNHHEGRLLIEMLLGMDRK